MVVVFKRLSKCVDHLFLVLLAAAATPEASAESKAPRDYDELFFEAERDLYAADSPSFDALAERFVELVQLDPYRPKAFYGLYLLTKDFMEQFEANPELASRYTVFNAKLHLDQVVLLSPEPTASYAVMVRHETGGYPFTLSSLSLTDRGRIVLGETSPDFSLKDDGWRVYLAAYLETGLGEIADPSLSAVSAELLEHALKKARGESRLSESSLLYKLGESLAGANDEKVLSVVKMLAAVSADLMGSQKKDSSPLDVRTNPFLAMLDQSSHAGLADWLEKNEAYGSPQARAFVESEIAVSRGQFERALELAQAAIAVDDSAKLSLKIRYNELFSAMLELSQRPVAEPGPLAVATQNLASIHRRLVDGDYRLEKQLAAFELGRLYLMAKKTRESSAKFLDLATVTDEHFRPGLAEAIKEIFAMFSAPQEYRLFLESAVSRLQSPAFMRQLASSYLHQSKNVARDAPKMTSLIDSYLLVHPPTADVILERALTTFLSAPPVRSNKWLSSSELFTRVMSDSPAAPLFKALVTCTEWDGTTTSSPSRLARAQLIFNNPVDHIWYTLSHSSSTPMAEGRDGEGAELASMCAGLKEQVAQYLSSQNDSSKKTN